jgi:hypothetical protein
MSIGSTNTMGSPDLDTRPAEMQRSTMGYWVQQCPHCNYCSENISKASKKAKAYVESSEYKENRDLLLDTDHPELAVSFICKSMIDNACKKTASSAWALIHAAWACDDDESTEQAKYCRIMAADAIILANEKGKRIMDQEGADTAILVDLVRRSGQIKKAKQVIAERKSKITEEIVIQILNYQSLLLDKDDVFCHTIDEALHANNASNLCT